MVPVFSPLPPLCSLNLSLGLSPDGWSSHWSSLNPGGWKLTAGICLLRGRGRQDGAAALDPLGQTRLTAAWTGAGFAALFCRCGASNSQTTGRGTETACAASETRAPKQIHTHTHTHTRFLAVEPSRYTSDFWAQMIMGYTIIMNHPRTDAKI